MKFFRSDHAKVIDKAKDGIPEGEPCFLLRASEVGTIATVRAWAQIARSAGVDDEITGRAMAWAELMNVWVSSLSTPAITDALVDLHDEAFLASMDLMTVEGHPAEEDGPIPKLIVRADGQSPVVVRDEVLAALDGVENVESVLAKLAAAGFEFTRSAKKVPA